MEFIETSLKGPYIIKVRPNSDERGVLMRMFCKKEFEKIRHNTEFLQINLSKNIHKGTLRGLHYQEPPYTEAKLVQCSAGSIFDVIVDIRKSSPTFLQWNGMQLSGNDLTMLFIPEGFAHGFLTLEDNSNVLYFHTEFYTPSAEKGLRYNDPRLKIKWPTTVNYISAKDEKHPLISEIFNGILI